MGQGTSRAAGFIVMALLVAGVARTASGASTALCGTKVTTDLKLSRDVGPCTGHGLVVDETGAGVTINLRGHRVFGVTGNTSDGIRISGTADVVVKNGFVSKFSEGVHIRNSSRVTVKKITATRNVGIAADNEGDGIFLENSSDSIIKNNRVFFNGPFSGISVFGSSSGNQIVKNVVRENDVPVSATHNEDIGIRIDNGATRTVVRNNEVSFNGLDGITTFDSPTPGSEPNNTITDNTVRGNGFHGTPARLGDGIRILNASGSENNLLEDNVLKENAGHGLGVDIGVTGNTVSNNNAVDNGLVDYKELDDSCAGNTYITNRGGTFDPTCMQG